MLTGLRNQGKHTFLTPIPHHFMTTAILLQSSVPGKLLDLTGDYGPESSFSLKTGHGQLKAGANWEVWQRKPHFCLALAEKQKAANDVHCSV